MRYFVLKQKPCEVVTAQFVFGGVACQHMTRGRIRIDGVSIAVCGEHKGRRR